MSDTTFTASKAFWRVAGIEPAPIVANLAHLISKRLLKDRKPAFFDEAGASAHIGWVLHGDRFRKRAGGSIAAWLFIREDDPRCVVIQLKAFKTAQGRAYRILSAYTLSKAHHQEMMGLEVNPAPGAGPVSSGSAPKSRKPGPQGLPSGQASRDRKKSKPKANPAPAFGTAERRRLYGSQEGGSRSGAKADKRKQVLSSYRKAQGQKAQEKAGRELFDSPDMKAKAKAFADEGKALARILGPTGRTHAVKLAKEQGTFREADVLAFLRSGWSVQPATTAPAKVGAGLGALEPFELAINPGPDFGKVLGPKGEARALVLSHHRASITSDVIAELRSAGFDVSPAPKAMREGNFGQKRPRAATRKAPGKQPESMKKSKAPAKAKTSRINPTSEADLAKVWTAWTGAKPGQVAEFELEKQTVEVAGGRIILPAKVALLGRVAKLITKSGQVKDFKDHGPLMVTDSKMKRVFLIHPKGFHFDVEPSLIAYLAKKPKFGDRGLVEYVHAFESRTRAVMAGQIGALTGGFRLTPRGIEG